MRVLNPNLYQILHQIWNVWNPIANHCLMHFHMFCQVGPRDALVGKIYILWRCFDKLYLKDLRQIPLPIPKSDGTNIA